MNGGHAAGEPAAGMGMARGERRAARRLISVKGQ